MSLTGWTKLTSNPEIAKHLRVPCCTSKRLCERMFENRGLSKDTQLLITTQSPGKPTLYNSWKSSILDMTWQDWQTNNSTVDEVNHPSCSSHDNENQTSQDWTHYQATRFLSAYAWNLDRSQGGQRKPFKDNIKVSLSCTCISSVSQLGKAWYATGIDGEMQLCEGKEWSCSFTMIVTINWKTNIVAKSNGMPVNHQPLKNPTALLKTIGF